jgi:hypothetical protein
MKSAPASRKPWVRRVSISAFCFAKLALSRAAQLLHAFKLRRIVGDELAQQREILQQHPLRLFVTAQIPLVAGDEIATPPAFHLHEVAQHFFLGLEDFARVRHRLRGGEETLRAFPCDEGNPDEHRHDEAEPEQHLLPDRKPGRGLRWKVGGHSRTGGR